MEIYSRICVSEPEEMIGNAIVRNLKKRGYMNLILASSDEVDLTSQREVCAFFKETKPEYVFLSAGKQGGIQENIEKPANLIVDNVRKQTNILESAYTVGVKKLLYFASACVYPRNCAQPMKEDDLMTGVLESTNSAYAIAKLAGIEMCRAFNRQYGTQFISVIPTNIFGPGDRFDLLEAHVCAALIRKIHEAKVKMEQGQPASVVIWGSGEPTREFLYADDVADASVFLMKHYLGEGPVNIGGGQNVSIRKLAFLIKEVLGYVGEMTFDVSKPDGMPAKWLDHSQLEYLGWKSKINLQQGIKLTYEWYLRGEGRG